MYVTESIDRSVFNTLFPSDITKLILDYLEDVVCDLCETPLTFAIDDGDYCIYDHNDDYDTMSVWSCATENDNDWWVCFRCRCYYTVHRKCQDLQEANGLDKFEYEEERAKKIREYISKPNRPVFSTFEGQDLEELDSYTYLIRGYQNKDGSDSTTINEFIVIDEQMTDDYREIILKKYDPPQGFLLPHTEEFKQYDDNNSIADYCDLSKFAYYVGDKKIHYMKTETPTGPDGGMSFYFRCEKCGLLEDFTDK